MRSARHGGSPFFARFFLRELIETNYPWAVAHRSGAGGGIGGGSGFAGAKKSSFHKSESYSCAIHLSGPDRFDEPKFIESLRSLIEKEITGNKATVSEQGALGPSAFYVDYCFEDLFGRVAVAGKLVMANYGLTSDVREQNDAHASRPGRPAEPEGEFYVVGITASDSLRQRNSLAEIGQRLITEMLQKRGLAKLSLQSPQFAEVFALFRIPPEIRRAVEEHQVRLNLELDPDPWEQYKEYEEVYFLNENAVRMYRNAGIKLNILKTLSADDLPKQSHRRLRVLYLPNES